MTPTDHQHFPPLQVQQTRRRLKQIGQGEMVPKRRRPENTITQAPKFQAELDHFE